MFKMANIAVYLGDFFLVFFFSFFENGGGEYIEGRKFLDMEGAEIIRRPRTGLMRGAKAPTVYWDSLGLVGIYYIYLSFIYLSM
jgi:hypothetical protein